MEVAGWAGVAPKPPKPVLAGAAPKAGAVGWAAPNVGATAPKGLAGCPNMPPAWVVVDPNPNAGRYRRLGSGVDAASITQQLIWSSCTLSKAAVSSLYL